MRVNSNKTRFLCCVGYFLLLAIQPLAPLSADATDDDDYASGEELYDLGCANCHGKNMVNPGTASFNLKQFPRDDKTRFIESVTHGKGFMPALGEVFDAGEIEQLWIYVSQHE